MVLLGEPKNEHVNILCSFVPILLSYIDCYNQIHTTYFDSTDLLT